MRDVNERLLGGGPAYGVVTKVGRKLVTVQQEGRYSIEQVYRLDTRRANDNYGRAYFQTPEEYEEGKRRASILADLRERGIELRLGYGNSITTDTLARILTAVSGVPETPDDGSIGPKSPRGAT